MFRTSSGSSLFGPLRFYRSRWKFAHCVVKSRMVEPSYSISWSRPMEQRRRKPRLTVIVGAGATTGAVIAHLRSQRDRSGNPLTEATIKNQPTYSTRDLTEKTRRVNGLQVRLLGTSYDSGPRNRPGATMSRVDSDIPVIPWLMRALEAHYESPNFEHLLAAIEDLEMFAANAHNLSVSDEHRTPLSAFFDPWPRHAFLMDQFMLREARSQVVASLMEYVPDARHAAASQYRENFDALRKSFDLDVFTLNYDLLLDAALTLDGETPFDGFTREIESHRSTARAFDRAGFLTTAQSASCTLIHLHGCKVFGYAADPTNTVRYDEIVKYPRTGDAVESVIGNLRPEHTQHGEILSAGPIISGVNKAAKITATMVPYGYYYQALGNAISANPRLLMIGYGGSDAHVNSWIAQFPHIHGRSRRAAIVLGGGASTWLSFTRQTTIDRLMDAVDNTISPKAVSQRAGLQKITDATLLSHDGFPISAKSIRAIAAFLKQARRNTQGLGRMR